LREEQERAHGARTVVRVVALEDAVVIGIRADDPQPARITSYARQRDASLGSEDHIKIVLDTYRDGRSGYVFSMATWWFGQFYNGRLDQYELTPSWKPAPLFIVELSGERNVGRMPQGDFTTNVVGTRFRLNVSPDLQLTSFVQYDDESNSFGTNTRLRWTFDPLGDLFVVYNHNLYTRDPVTLLRRIAFASNQLLVKVQYAFRY
jgi:hypothetical protein